MQRIVRNFEQLGQKMRTAAGKSVYATTNRMEIIHKEFSNGVKEYETAVDNLQKKSAKMRRQNWFKTMNEDSKKFFNNAVTYQRNLLNLNKQTAKAIANYGSQFDPNKIKRTIGNLNQVAKALKIDLNIDPKEFANSLRNQLHALRNARDPVLAEKATRNVQAWLNKNLKGLDLDIQLNPVVAPAKKNGNVTKKARSAVQEAIKAENKETFEIVKQAATEGGKMRRQAYQKLAAITQGERTMSNREEKRFVQQAIREITSGPDAKIFRNFYLNGRGVQAKHVVQSATKVKQVRDKINELKKLARDEGDLVKDIGIIRNRINKKYAPVLDDFVSEMVKGSAVMSQAQLSQRKQDLIRKRNLVKAFEEAEDDLVNYGRRRSKRKFQELTSVIDGMEKEYQSIQSLDIGSKIKRGNVAAQMKEIRDVENEIRKMGGTVRAARLRDLKPEDLADIDRTANMLNERLDNALRQMKDIKQKRANAEDQIKRLGTYRKGPLPEGMKYDDALVKMERKRLKQIYKDLDAQYDDSMKSLRGLVDDYSGKKQGFMKQAMATIRKGDDQTIRTLGVGAYMESAVAIARKREAAALKKQMDGENNWKRKHYVEAYQDLYNFSEMMSTLRNKDAQRIAKDAKDRAISIYNSDSVAMKEFSKGRDRYLDLYRSSLAEEKRINDQELQNAMSHSTRLGRIGRRLGIANRREIVRLRERNEQISKEMKRAQEMEAGDAFGGGGVGGGRGGGTGGGPPNERFFRPGRGGMPNVMIDRYQASVDRLERSKRRLERTMGSLNSLFYTFGAGLGIYSLAQYYDQWVQFSNRIKLVTTSMQELRDVQQDLIGVSNRTATSLFSSGGLFEKFSRAGDRYGVSNQIKTALTELVQQTVIISGSTTEGAKGAIIQFVQGLATELRGQELTSVREQIPRLARAIAEGLDVPISKLKQLGAQGLITGDQIMMALIKQIPRIQAEFQNVSFTITQSFELISNSMSEMIGKAMDELNASQSVSKFFETVAKYIQSITQEGSLTKLLKTLFDLKEEIVAIIKVLGTAFLVGKGTNLLSGAAGLIGARSIGTGMNIGAAMRERGMGNRLGALFGGGFYDATGKGYTAAERKKIIEMNEQIRKQNEKFASKGKFNKMTEPLDIPQRRSTIGQGLEKSAFWLTAFGALMYQSSEQFRKVVDQVGSWLGSVFDTLIEYTKELLMKLNIIDTPEEAQAEANRQRRIENDAEQGLMSRLTRRMANITSDEKSAAQEITREEANRLIRQKVELEKRLETLKESNSWMNNNTAEIYMTQKELAEVNRDIANLTLFQLDMQEGLLKKSEDRLKVAKLNAAIIEIDYNKQRLINKELEERREIRGDFNKIGAQLKSDAEAQARMFDTEGEERLLKLQSQVSKTSEWVESYQQALIRRTNLQSKLETLTAEAAVNPEKQEYYNSELERTENQLKSVNEEMTTHFFRFNAAIALVEELAGGNYSKGVTELANSLRTSLMATRMSYSELDKLYRAYVNAKTTIERDRDKFIDDSQLQENEAQIANMRAGVLKRLATQDELMDKRTNEVIKQMNVSTQRYIQAMPIRSGEIDRAYQLGVINAQNEYESKVDEIRKDSLNQLNSQFEFKKESEIDLIANPQFRTKVRTAYNEWRTQVAQLANEQKRNVAELEREVELSQDLSALQKKTLELTRQAGTAMNAFREKGISDTMNEIMLKEKEMQKQLIASITDYMVTTGDWFQFNAEQFMERMARGDLESAIAFVEGRIEVYQKKSQLGDQKALEIYNNLTKILLGIRSGIIGANIEFENQLQSQLSALRETNEELRQEMETYVDMTTKFLNQEMTLALNDAGDPITAAASSLLNQLQQIRTSRKLLEKNRDKVGADLSSARMEGDTDTARILGSALSVENQKILNNQQQERNAITRTTTDLLNQVSIEEARIAQDKTRYLREESVLNERLMQLQVDQLDLEHRRTELNSKRLRGTQLTTKELMELAQVEERIANSAMSARRMEREHELSTIRDRQVLQSQLSLDILIAEADTQEKKNTLTDAQKTAVSNINEFYNLQLIQLSDLLEAEERLARKRRENAIEAQLLQSGLFTKESLQSFTGSKSVMAQLLEDPIFGPMVSKGVEAKRFLQGRNSPLNQFSIDALLGQYSEFDETTGLYKDPEIRKILEFYKKITTEKNGVEEETLRQSIISKRQQLQDIADIEDLTRRSETILSNSTRSSDKVIQLLEDQREQGQQQLEINFLTEVALQAIEENVTIGSQRYQEIYREKRRQFDLNSVEELFRLDRQFVQGIRDEYKYLENEIFDLTKLSEGQLLTLAPLMQGLQEYAEVERRMTSPVSSTPEMRLIEAESLKKKELAKVDAALREGRYKDVEVIGQNIVALDLLIQKLQVSAEKIGIYTEELTKATKANMQLQLEQSINSMQNSEREMQVQLEMAQLRKEAILTESQLAEVEAGKRKILAQQEIADQEEILYLQTQQKLAALEVAGYDPNSPENIGKRQQIEAEYLQQSRLLSLQERQQLAAIDAQEQLRKLNEEQNKSLNEMESSLERIFGSYFSFIGNIFGTIFDAIFGSAKKQEEFNPAKLAEDRIKQLERDKKEIENEINFVLEPNAEHYVDNTEALRSNTVALNKNTRSHSRSLTGETSYYETGGLLHGPSHDQGGINMGRIGGVRIEAEGGEYIVRKSSVSKLGLGTLNYINEHGQLPYGSNIFNMRTPTGQIKRDLDGGVGAEYRLGGLITFLTAAGILTATDALAGVLGGKSAKGFDEAAYQRFLAGEQSGKDPNQLWGEHGIFRYVDNNPYFYINTGSAPANEDIINLVAAGGRSSLYDLYPSLGDVYENYPWAKNLFIGRLRSNSRATGTQISNAGHWRFFAGQEMQMDPWGQFNNRVRVYLDALGIPEVARKGTNLQAVKIGNPRLTNLFGDISYADFIHQVMQSEDSFLLRHFQDFADQDGRSELFGRELYRQALLNPADALIADPYERNLRYLKSIIHDEVFKDFDYKYRTQDSKDSGTHEYQNILNPMHGITIAQSLLQPGNSEELRSTVIHELQHAIQETEGYGSGGSPEGFSAVTSNPLMKDLSWLRFTDTDFAPRMSRLGTWGQSKRDEALQGLRARAELKSDLQNLRRDNFVNTTIEDDFVKYYLGLSSKEAHQRFYDELLGLQYHVHGIQGSRQERIQAWEDSYEEAVQELEGIPNSRSRASRLGAIRKQHTKNWAGSDENFHDEAIFQHWRSFPISAFEKDYFEYFKLREGRAPFGGRLDDQEIQDMFEIEYRSHNPMERESWVEKMLDNPSAGDGYQYKRVITQLLEWQWKLDEYVSKAGTLSKVWYNFQRQNADRKYEVQLQDLMEYQKRVHELVAHFKTAESGKNPSREIDHGYIQRYQDEVATLYTSNNEINIDSTTGSVTHKTNEEKAEARIRAIQEKRFKLEDVEQQLDEVFSSFSHAGYPTQKEAYFQGLNDIDDNIYQKTVEFLLNMNEHQGRRYLDAWHLEGIIQSLAIGDAQDRLAKYLGVNQVPSQMDSFTAYYKIAGEMQARQAETMDQLARDNASFSLVETPMFFRPKKLSLLNHGLVSEKMRDYRDENVGVVTRKDYINSRGLLSTHGHPFGTLWRDKSFDGVPLGYDRERFGLTFSTETTEDIYNQVFSELSGEIQSATPDWVNPSNFGEFSKGIPKDVLLSALLEFMPAGRALNMLRKLLSVDNLINQPTDKYASGGMLRGPSHAQGGIHNVELEGGEYIIKKSSVDKIGKGVLDYVNASGDIPTALYAGGGCIPKKRFADGGYVDLSMWPYGTASPYLQMGADWTQVIGPKPDNSAAEAEMRKAIYEGIKAGAEAAIREREEAKEIESHIAWTNITNSLDAHIERKKKFIDDIDRRVQEKMDRINQSELALINIQSEHAKNNILAARDSARQRTLAISGSKQSYEDERASAYLAFANAGESQRRMASFWSAKEQKTSEREVLKVGQMRQKLRLGRDRYGDIQNTRRLDQQDYNENILAPRIDGLTRLVEERDRKFLEWGDQLISKLHDNDGPDSTSQDMLKGSYVDPVMVGMGLNPSLGDGFVSSLEKTESEPFTSSWKNSLVTPVSANADGSYVYTDPHQSAMSRYAGEVKKGTPQILDLSTAKLLKKAESTALEARATRKSDMTDEGLREILDVEATMQSQRKDILGQLRDPDADLDASKRQALNFQFQELGQSLSDLKPSIASWMDQLEISDQMQDFIGSIDNAVLKQYASQIVQEERITTEEALNEKLKERFSGEDKYVESLKNLQEKRFETGPEGNAGDKKDFWTRLEEGTAADAKKITEAVTPKENAGEGVIDKMLNKAESSVQDYFKERTTTYNKKGEKEHQYSGDPSVFNALTNYAEDAGDALLAVAKVIPGRVGQAANTFAAQLANGTDPIKAMGAAALQFVLSNEKVQKVLAKAGEVIEAILDPLIELFMPVLNVLVDSLKLFFEAIEPLIPMIQALGEVIGNIARFTMGPANAVMGAVGQAVDAVANALGFSTTPSQDEKDRQALKAIKDAMKSKNEELDKKYDGELKTIADSYKDQYKAAAQIQDASMRQQAEAAIAETLNRERLMHMTEQLTESFRSAAEAISQAAESIGISTIDLASILTAEIIASEQAGGQSKLFTNPKQGRKTFTTAELLGEEGKGNGDPFMLGLIARAYGRDDMTYEDLREGFQSSGNELASGKNWSKWTKTVKHGTLGLVKHYHKYAAAIKNDNALLDSILQDTEDRISQGKRDGFAHINQVIGSTRGQSIEQIVANKIGGLSYDAASDSWTYLGPILSDVTAMLISSFQQGATDMSSINFTLEASEAALGRFKDALVGYVQELIDRRGLVEKSEYNLVTSGGFEDFASFYANAGRGGYEAQISAAVTAYNDKLTGGAKGSDSLIRTVWEAATTPVGTASEDQEAINQMAYNTLTAAEQELVSNVLSIMVQRAKAFNDAMEDATAGLGRYTFAQQQAVDKTRYAEELVSQGWTQEQAESLMRIFDEKQVIELQRSMLELTNEFKSMKDSIAETTQSFYGLTNYFGDAYDVASAGSVTEVDKIVTGLTNGLAQSLLGMGIGLNGPAAASAAASTAAAEAASANDPENIATNNNTDATTALNRTNENLIKAITNNTLALQGMEGGFSADQIFITDASGNRVSLADYNTPASGDDSGTDTTVGSSTSSSQIPGWLESFIKPNAQVDFSSITDKASLVTALEGVVLDGINVSEMMTMTDAELSALPDSLRELAIKFQMLGLQFDKAAADIEALNLAGGRELYFLKIENAMDSSMGDMLSLIERINEIKQKNYETELEISLIEQERLKLKYAREDSIEEIEGRGYSASSQTFSINQQYDKDLSRVGASITEVNAAIAAKKLAGESWKEEADTLAHLTKKQTALTEARERELKVIKDQMIKTFSEIGVQFTELGTINKNFESNLQTIADEFGVSFSIDSLGMGDLSGDIDDILDSILTFPAEMGDAEIAAVKEIAKEAIEARNRELTWVKDNMISEERNRVADFFGVSNEEYTFVDFQEAMKSLKEVIESLDKTIEDIYYSDLNPTPFIEKLESSESKYAGLLMKAITPNAEGSYDAEAISEFQGYAQTYLGYQRDMYKSSSEYVEAYNRVMSDLESVKNVATLYGTKSETDKLIEALGDLADTIEMEGGTADEIEGIITQIESALPESMNAAYGAMTDIVGDIEDEMEGMGITVKGLVKGMSSTVIANVNTITQSLGGDLSGWISTFSGLFAEGSSLMSFPETFSGTWEEIFDTDPTNSNSLISSFKTFIDKIRGWVDDAATKDPDAGKSNSDGPLEVTPKSQTTSNSDDPNPYAPTFSQRDFNQDIGGQYTIDGTTYDVAPSTYAKGIGISDISSTDWQLDGENFLKYANESTTLSGHNYTDWFVDKNGTYVALDLSQGANVPAIYDYLNSAGNTPTNWGSLSSYQLGLDDPSNSAVATAIKGLVKESVPAARTVDAIISKISDNKLFDFSPAPVFLADKNLSDYTAEEVVNAVIDQHYPNGNAPHPRAVVYEMMVNGSMKTGVGFMDETANSLGAYDMMKHTSENRRAWGDVDTSTEWKGLNLNWGFPFNNSDGWDNWLENYEPLNLGFANGGLLTGRSHAQGGMHIEAEGGEYIIRKSAVAKLGVPYLDYLNEEGALPFMRFGMGDFLRQDQEVGIAEVNSSDGELKALIRELIQAIQDGDKSITDAIEELEVNPDINVYTDLEGEVKAQLYAYDEKIKERSKRGLR